MAETKTAPSTAVIIGPVRLSYPAIWAPKAVEEGGKLKYSASLIISKSDKKNLTIVKNAIEAAKLAGKEKLGKITSSLKVPLRDGDEDRPEDEAYENSMFFNASSDRKPGVVDKDRNPVMDQDEVYAGCYVYVSVNFYAFDKPRKGIAAGLNNIMKVKDGERLSAGRSAEEDFADIAIEVGDDDEDFG